MYYFGKVFVEFWRNDRWNLSAVWFWQYILMRLWGFCGAADSNLQDYEYRHVPRRRVHFN